VTARAVGPMRLGDLFAGVDRAALTAALCDVEVGDISTNSRDAARGGLFLACAGQQSHGLDYVGDALGAGVAAVAWEPVPGVGTPELPAGVASLPVPGLGAHLGVLADRFFAGPSAELTVTGVTGTNGKSTTAYIAAQALRALDQPAGYMGTLGFGIGTDLEPSRLTTPGCVDVHRRLRKMADAGARHVVMEVSSHALDQDRVAGVRFSTAALTNISRDHLDYHGNMSRYAEAKARLFLDSDIRAAVINTGNDYGTQLAQRLDGVHEPAVDVLSVALVETNAASGSDARLLGHLRGARADGIGMRLSGDFGDAMLDSPLWGSFNGENLLVAAGLLLALGSDLDAAVAALRDCVAPAGRMELIRGGSDAPTVVVDYAHTPDALHRALEAVREHTSGRVWCVFGCGGDRDRGKRAEMGAVAVAFADHTVVTDDNPRSEDPQAIIEDILTGASGGLEVIRERSDAIGHAIASAGANDSVLIAGKGHESVQQLGSVEREFSDARAARAALGRVA